MKALEHLASLHQQELWDEVIFLYELLPPQLPFAPKGSALAHSYAADAYYQNEKMLLAQRAFYNALDVHKTLARQIQTPRNVSEVEVRFRLHKCLVKQAKYEEAMAVLVCIQPSAMPAKVKSAIAKLRMRTMRFGEDSATSMLKHVEQVADSCPSALKALSTLAAQGVRTSSHFPQIEDVPFVEIWARAQEMVGAGKWMDAVGLLKNNAQLSPRMAALESSRILNLIGLREEACRELQRACNLDLEQTEPCAQLAFMLSKEDKAKDLEALVARLHAVDENSMEAWVSYGYLSRMRNKKHEVALHLAHRATLAEPKQCSDAQLLKALVLNDLEKHDDALSLLLEASAVDPLNVDIHEAVVCTLLLLGRPEQARFSALSALQACKNAPRAVLIHAHVQLKSKNDALAHSLLEELIEKYPYMVDAITTLVDIYKEHKQYDKAVKLLKKVQQAPHHWHGSHTARFSSMLGDLLTRSRQPVEAYHHINRAIIGGEDAASALAQLNADMDEEEDDEDDEELSGLVPDSQPESDPSDPNQVTPVFSAPPIPALPPAPRRPTGRRSYAPPSS